jgi:hypothetical protein
MVVDMSLFEQELNLLDIEDEESSLLLEEFQDG